MEGSELRFHFKGKSGKTWRLHIRDRRVAGVIRSIQELPGQHLFQYLDDEGTVRTVASNDVNDYLRELTSAEVSAKDFRTWAGTVLAVMALGALEAFTSQAQAEMNVRRALEVVPAKFGNTPTICRKCYVHPEFVACYMEGTLLSVRAWDGTRGRPLPREEAAVLRFLKGRLSPKRPLSRRNFRSPERAAA